MFNKRSTASEIEAAMEIAMVPQISEGLSKVAQAIEHLNVAAELFDDLGLLKEAEYTTALLEAIAAKKSKKKSKKKSPVKSKKPSKRQSKRHSKTKLESDKMVEHDSSMAGLTSEKMLDNLANKGWVFNADDYNDSQDVYDDLEADDADDFNFDFDTDEDATYTMRRDDNYADPYDKDEHEQDLARIMHEIEEDESGQHSRKQHFMPPPPYMVEMPSIPKYRPQTKNWHDIEETSVKTVRPHSREEMEEFNEPGGMWDRMDEMGYEPSWREMGDLPPKRRERYKEDESLLPGQRHRNKPKFPGRRR
jgi:hypothetical protein